jgi:hypothetical protein
MNQSRPLFMVGSSFGSKTLFPDCRKPSQIILNFINPDSLYR